MMPKFLLPLINPNYRVTAIRVALVVGTALFFINHGTALANKKMNRNRWISGFLTYGVPYLVSIHGQHSNSQKKKN